MIETSAKKHPGLVVTVGTIISTYMYTKLIMIHTKLCIYRMSDSECLISAMVVVQHLNKETRVNIRLASLGSCNHPNIICISSLSKG